MRRATRRRFGVLLWVLGAIAAVGWSALRPAPSTQGWVGYGASVVVEVSALEEGRVESVDVGLHDSVSAGQILARMDPAPLERLREIRAAELLALAGPTPGDLQSELKAARSRSRMIQKRAELAAIDARLDQLRRLVADGAASQSEVDDANTRRNILIRDLARADSGAPDSRNLWQVVAAAKRIDDLDARIEATQLVSSLDGQVTAVFHQPGEVVRRGDPLLQVRKPATDEVIAWAQPGAVVSSGSPMTVVRSDGSELSGSVLSVGSGPTLLPSRSWRDPRREEWGIAVRVRLDEGVILPDEPVLVRL